MKQISFATLTIGLATTLAAARTAQASDITPSVVNVRVSSEQTGNVGRNSIDGNLTTRWSANGDGQWIDYDLGTVQHIGNVTVAFYLGDQRQARFDLQTGDGTMFTTRFSGTSSGTTTALQSYTVNADARFLRIVGHGTTAGTWNSITEVHIFNGATAATPTPTPTPGSATPTPTPTMAAATPTPTPTASGNVLFRNTGTTAGWDGRSLEHNGTISQVTSPVYKGETSLRVTQTYDPSYTGRYHAEVVRNDGYKPGQMRFYGFAFYIPSNWQSVSQGYNIAQFIADFNDTGCDDWSPTTMMWFTNSGLSTRIKQGTICSQSLRVFSNIATLSYGQWHRIQIQGNWQPNSTGSFRVWVDGVNRLDQTNLQTTLASDPRNRTFSFRLGMYANSWFDQKRMVGTQSTRVLNYDHVSIGASYADSDPEAW